MSSRRPCTEPSTPLSTNLKTRWITAQARALKGKLTRRATHPQFSASESKTLSNTLDNPINPLSDIPDADSDSDSYKQLESPWATSASTTVCNSPIDNGAWGVNGGKMLPDVIRHNSDAIVETSLNTLTLTLELLGTAPFPGLSFVTTTLVQVLRRAQQIPANCEGLRELSDRLTCLCAVTSVLKSDCSEDEAVQKISARLHELMYRMAYDISVAESQGTIVKFFNSVSTSNDLKKHTTQLDSITLDLSAAIGVSTYQNVNKILEKLQGEPLGVRDQKFDFSNAIIDTTSSDNQFVGNVASNNQGGICFIAQGARINSGGGHIATGNNSH